jgi:hypothetical protein
MYDFYALCNLYWKAGGVKMAPIRHRIDDGSQPTECSSDPVTAMLESCCFQLSMRLGTRSSAAAQLELMHLADETLIPPEAYRDWSDNIDDPKLPRLYSAIANRVYVNTDVYRMLSIESVAKLLTADFWEKYADNYGGPKWAEILHMGYNLICAVKNGAPLPEWVALIDCFYGMKHNTGWLATKMGDFAVDKVDMDVRSRLIGTQTLARLVSPPVAQVLISSPGFARIPISTLIIARIPASKKKADWKIITDSELNTFLVPKVGFFQPLKWPTSGAFFGKCVSGGIKIAGHVYPEHLFQIEHY